MSEDKEDWMKEALSGLTKFIQGSYKSQDILNIKKHMHDIHIKISHNKGNKYDHDTLLSLQNELELLEHKHERD